MSVSAVAVVAVASLTGAPVLPDTRGVSTAPEQTVRALTVVRGACPHDCPDTCAWEVTVEDGRAVKLRGVKEHPFTRGGLCAKVNHYLERVYSPERLLHPLRRTGPKGEAPFERDRLGRGARRDRRPARRRSSPSTAARRSCPTATWARRAWCRRPRSTGASSRGSGRPGSSARSADRRPRRATPRRRAARRGCSRRTSATAGSSCSGGRTRSSPTCTCGRSSRRRGKNGARVVVIDPVRDAHRAVGRLARAAAARHRRRARARAHARDRGRGPARRRLRRAPHGGVRAAPRSGSRSTRPSAWRRSPGLAEDEIVELARAYATTRPRRSAR